MIQSPQIIALSGKQIVPEIIERKEKNNNRMKNKRQKSIIKEWRGKFEKPNSQQCKTVSNNVKIEKP